MYNFMRVAFGLVTLLVAVVISSAGDLPEGVTVGDKAPNFELTNVDGKLVSLETFRSTKGVILVFTCNHCPYSIKYEDRIIALHEKFAPKGVPVLAVNPNDSTIVPEDSYQKMIERAAEREFKFPYVLDGTQKTALAYGARRTPHVFLLKRVNNGFVVEYIGAIDDNANDEEAVNLRFVENAVGNMLDGKAQEVATTKAIGCTIKWRKD